MHFLPNICLAMHPFVAQFATLPYKISSLYLNNSSGEMKHCYALKKYIKSLFFSKDTSTIFIMLFWLR